MTTTAPPRMRGTQLRIPGVPETRLVQSLNAQTVFVGDWGEEFAHRLVGGDRLQTMSGMFCPDLQLPGQQYVEVKMVSESLVLRISNRACERYDETPNARVLIIFHDTRPTQFVGETVARLRNHMHKHVLSVAWVPWCSVRDNMLPPQDSGFRRLSTPWLRQLRDGKPHRKRRTFPVCPYGTQVPMVPARTFHCKWPPGARVGIWPGPYQVAAQDMLTELDGNWHTVGLVDLPDGRRVRQVFERNAPWYEQLVRQYPEGAVQRRVVRRALARIAANKYIDYRVESYLAPCVEQWADTVPPF